MTHAELVARIAEGAEVGEDQAKAMLAALTDAVVDGVAADGEVQLRGLGKWKAKARSARKGRNPATGDTIDIAASTGIAFTASSALRKRVNG